MIELSHIGETLIARILNESVNARDYMRSTGSEFGQNIIAIPELRPNNCGSLMFDGTHRIDIAVLDHDNKICHPIEAKLGLDRLAKFSFNKRFLNDCSTSHNGSRVCGSMIAILERKLPPQCRHLPLYVTHNGDTYQVSDNWTLVCRAQVAVNWTANGSPDLSAKCTIVTFENLVKSFGDRERFNKLVQSMLDEDFYSRWVKSDNP
jgi:hypothetical protein